jgi:hypothetical protein
MLYRALLFTLVPTTIEFVFVVGLLWSRFSPMVAAVVGCTFAMYVAWTLSMTQVRARACLCVRARCVLVCVWLCLLQVSAERREACALPARAWCRPARWWHI